MKKLIGPALTVLFTILYHLTTAYFGWTFTVGGIWVFMVIGAFISGFRASLVAATFASFYAYYVMPDDLSGWIQRVLWGFLIAGAVGYLRKRERRESDLLNKMLTNGNVDKITHALEAARQLPDSEQKMQIESDLGNALSVIVGFNHLWQEVQQVEKWYRNPFNVIKWRLWRRDNE